MGGWCFSRLLTRLSFQFIKLLTIRKIASRTNVMTGRMESFTHTAHLAQSGNPRNISKAEGWLLVVQSMGIAVLLAVSFQSHLWEWGGIIRMLAQIVFIILIILVSRGLAKTRRVHPRGFKWRLTCAGILPVVVAVIGGWFWTAPTFHDTSWIITTAVAVGASLPGALVGLELVVRGNK